MTTLAESLPGCILAVVENGRTVCMELGGFIGVPNTTKKRALALAPETAIVHDRDMHTHDLVEPRGARCVPASLEVVAVIDMPVWRRAREDITRRGKRDRGHEEESADDMTDPMLGRPKPTATW